MANIHVCDGLSENPNLKLYLENLDCPHRQALQKIFYVNGSVFVRQIG